MLAEERFISVKPPHDVCRVVTYLEYKVLLSVISGRLVYCYIPRHRGCRKKRLNKETTQDTEGK